MTLTSPAYTNESSQCVTVIRSIDRDIRLSIPLTTGQVEAWSDADLTTRVTDLVNAIKGFLVPGESLRVEVAWNGAARHNIITSDETI